MTTSLLTPLRLSLSKPCPAFANREKKGSPSTSSGQAVLFSDTVI